VASAAFEASRPALIAFAHQLLRDPDRAEDAVLEAWLLCELGALDADASETDFLNLVGRLCRPGADAVHPGRERPSSAAVLDRVSMVFLGLLHRLTPRERAVLLLHDVFDLDHRRVAGVLACSEGDCRRLRARVSGGVAACRRTLAVSRREQGELLRRLVRVAGGGDIPALRGLLVKDAVLVARLDDDQPRVLCDRDRIAAVVATLLRDRPAMNVVRRECELDDEPAVVVLRDERAFAAVLISAADGRIRQLFVYADG
jgi:RNA polymerase sigma-70 factor (ECF subfamily)